MHEHPNFTGRTDRGAPRSCGGYGRVYIIPRRPVGHRRACARLVAWFAAGVAVGMLAEGPAYAKLEFERIALVTPARSSPPSVAMPRASRPSADAKRSSPSRRRAVRNRRACASLVAPFAAGVRRPGARTNDRASYRRASSRRIVAMRPRAAARSTRSGVVEATWAQVSQ
jgi:hypothetical protein